MSTILSSHLLCEPCDSIADLVSFLMERGQSHEGNHKEEYKSKDNIDEVVVDFYDGYQAIYHCETLSSGAKRIKRYTSNYRPNYKARELIRMSVSDFLYTRQCSRIETLNGQMNLFVSKASLQGASSPGGSSPFFKSNWENQNAS